MKVFPGVVGGESSGIAGAGRGARDEDGPSGGAKIGAAIGK